MESHSTTFRTSQQNWEDSLLLINKRSFINYKFRYNPPNLTINIERHVQFWRFFPIDLSSNWYRQIFRIVLFFYARDGKRSDFNYLREERESFFFLLWPTSAALIKISNKKIKFSCVRYDIARKGWGKYRNAIPLSIAASLRLIERSTLFRTWR